MPLAASYVLAETILASILKRDIMADERKKIGLREVRALKEHETAWDSAVAGFGIRRQNSMAVSYILFYRTKEGRQRMYTIGRHGAPWTPDAAREKAQMLLGDVAKGLDPAATKQNTRKAATVAELCDLYFEDAEAGRLLTHRKKPKKASTLATDKGRIERHIKPILGRVKVAAVTSRDIENFMNAVAEGETAIKAKTARKHGMAIVRGGKGTATRTVGLLGGIFSYAVRHKMRPDNPVNGVVRFADGKRERRLSDDEYKGFAKALQKAERAKIWPSAIAVARFLVLTGWRSGEALNLTWGEVDIVRRTALLTDTKTGRSMRPLSHLACAVLKGVPRRRDSDLVFEATRGDGPMVGFPKLWARIRELSRGDEEDAKKQTKSKKKQLEEQETGLPEDVTPHVLRHSFASLAADLGYSELTIAALVGHKGHSVTSRYTHHADTVLLAAADMVANRTAELMGNPSAIAEVIPLQRTKK